MKAIQFLNLVTENEAEAYALKDPHRALEYAKSWIDGRWLDAEPIIATSTDVAFRYACDVIKGRWPEGEAAIKRDRYLWQLYKDMVVGVKDL